MKHDCLGVVSNNNYSLDHSFLIVTNKHSVNNIHSNQPVNRFTKIIHSQLDHGCKSLNHKYIRILARNQGSNFWNTLAILWTIYFLIVILYLDQFHVKALKFKFGIYHKQYSTIILLWFVWSLAHSDQLFTSYLALK